MKTTIIIIDNDLGFVFWLGQALDKHGYEAFPAKSIPDAIKLIEELDLSISLVIVNCSLPGSTAFLAGIRQKRACVKVIGLAEGEHTPSHPEEDWQWCKPEAIDELSKLEFLLQVHHILGDTVESDLPMMTRQMII